MIDIGEDHALQPDQLLLAGRKILGQIDQVGIWTSTFRPLTHEEFRCPAVVMNARTGLRAEQSVGSFHGTGEELCELLYIENTLPVGVGDFVVLADPEQRFGGLSFWGPSPRHSCCKAARSGKFAWSRRYPSRANARCLS
ncbi:MAG: rod shape-determining protein MreC [Planctomycetaceae bacterium]